MSRIMLHILYHIFKQAYSLTLLVFSLDDTRRSASAAPLSHGATSLKIRVRFTDVGVKSVDIKIIFFQQIC